MAKLPAEFEREGWEAFVHKPQSGPAPSGDGRRQVNWDYRSAGLIREGVHADIHAIAMAPDGTQILVDVVPIPVNGGRETLLAIPPSNADKSAEIFPRTTNRI